MRRLEKRLFRSKPLDVRSVSDFIRRGGNVNVDEESVIGYKSSGYTLLQRAVNERAVDIVSLLIDAGADVQQCEDAEDLPLMMAVGVCNETIVKLLIDAGANVGAT